MGVSGKLGSGCWRFGHMFVDPSNDILGGVWQNCKQEIGGANPEFRSQNPEVWRGNYERREILERKNSYDDEAMVEGAG